MTTRVPDEALERFLSQFHTEHDVDSDAAFSNTGNRSIVPEGQRKCPICDDAMGTESRDGVKLDVCPSHGVWLDHGELEVICRRMDLVRERIIQTKIREAYERGVAHGRSVCG